MDMNELIECSKKFLQQLQDLQVADMLKDQKISELQSELDKYTTKDMSNETSQTKVDSALYNKINFELENNQDYIVIAARDGLVEEVKLLLKDSRVNPAVNEDSICYSALGQASKNGHSEVVKVLLADSRVNPAENNNIAIRNASDKGHFNVVELLLKDPRVNPAANNNIAIRSASSNGHLKIVQLLIADERVSKLINQ